MNQAPCSQRFVRTRNIELVECQLRSLDVAAWQRRYEGISRGLDLREGSLAEALYDYDPINDRENRQRLAKAVQARGFYVGSSGKGKGKSSSKGDPKKKGKSKGPKRRKAAAVQEACRWKS